MDGLSGGDRVGRVVRILDLSCAAIEAYRCGLVQVVCDYADGCYVEWFFAPWVFWLGPDWLLCESMVPFW